ncbi:MAG: F0F1 ATP synthase subunit gamma, partial [Candidatus Competibacteraceae bacterium]|nr:F0F1 ATP synthase subunit gamma [Candidatus Competibacteraceae bacterium]
TGLKIVDTLIPIGRRLQPTFTAWGQRSPSPGSPPRTHLPPRQLLQELADHYLFAALNELFHASLLAENQRRAEHLEGAFKRLEEQRDRLRRVDNRLRQEEITEEIEVLLLNASQGEPLC